MIESTLAATEDAQLILKLYELRTEPLMREARHWITMEFNPTSLADFAPLQAFGSRENAFFRQVTSYWEMAAAFVLHGALNAELFLDCNGEPFFLYAKFKPFLAEIRQQVPGFLRKTEQIVEQYPEAQERVEAISRMLAARQGSARRA